MKGLLCLIMLLAHTVFSLGYEATGSTAWKLISHAVNLTAFPGFLFCFGFVCERAYLGGRGRKAVGGRLLRRFLIILAAYYISALTALALSAEPVTAARILAAFCLMEAGGLTYLLAFALLFLILYLFYGPIDRLIGHGWLVALTVVASLACAALPAVGSYVPLIDLFVKVKDGAGFPLLPWFGFFVWGAYASRKRLSFDWRTALFALLAFAAFALYVLMRRALPKRFPPSLFWVLGGFLPVYALYLLTGLCRGRFWDAVLTPFGRHTLYYLTASNVLLSLYAYLAERGGFIMPRALYLPCYAALVLLCWAFFHLYRRIRGDRTGVF